MYCSKKCLAEYMLCIGEKAAERAFNTMAEAVKWLREHPEVVVGTIILVAGVAYMVATTGTGGMVLVLL